MAIAFGHSSSAIVGASPLTVSHTCTGDNYLLVAVFCPATSDTTSGVTYAGTSMSKLGSAASDSGPNDYTLVVYGLASPATGANNVVITASANIGMYGLSYSGANGGFDNIGSFSTTGTATSVTASVLTKTDNAWTTAFYSDGGGNPTASTGITNQRFSGAPGGAGAGDTGPRTPTGTYSMTANFTSGPASNMVIISLAPTSGGGATTHLPFLSIMGVGQ